jgi:uncharacterized lipoprotein YehR (DUF1307 family)
MKRVIGCVAAVAMLFGLAACGESEQVVRYQQGKYQGKPDGKPWDNEALATDGKWTKGDKVSWENQLKQRNQGQNEYKRIYQQ